MNEDFNQGDQKAEEIAIFIRLRVCPVFKQKCNQFEEQKAVLGDLFVLFIFAKQVNNIVVVERLAYDKRHVSGLCLLIRLES